MLGLKKKGRRLPNLFPFSIREYIVHGGSMPNYTLHLMTHTMDNIRVKGGGQAPNDYDSHDRNYEPLRVHPYWFPLRGKCRGWFGLVGVGFIPAQPTSTRYSITLVDTSVKTLSTSAPSRSHAHTREVLYLKSLSLSLYNLLSKACTTMNIKC